MARSSESIEKYLEPHIGYFPRYYEEKNPEICIRHLELVIDALELTEELGYPCHEYEFLIDLVPRGKRIIFDDESTENYTLSDTTNENALGAVILSTNPIRLEIFLYSKLDEEKTIFTILHELGHIYHWNNTSDKESFLYSTKSALHEGFAGLFATKMIQSIDDSFEPHCKNDYMDEDYDSYISKIFGSGKDLAECGNLNGSKFLRNSYDLIEAQRATCIYKNGYEFFKFIENLGFDKQIEIAMNSKNDSQFLKKLTETIYDETASSLDKLLYYCSFGVLRKNKLHAREKFYRFLSFKREHEKSVSKLDPSDMKCLEIYTLNNLKKFKRDYYISLGACNALIEIYNSANDQVRDYLELDVDLAISKLKNNREMIKSNRRLFETLRSSSTLENL